MKLDLTTKETVMGYTIFTVPVLSTLLRAISRLAYMVSRWSAVGEIPPTLEKCIVIAAPHTSNWDFPLMLMAALQLRVNVRWMGKHTLFVFPWGSFMKFLGGIPIDRTRSHNVVQVSAEELLTANGIRRLAITPEGTRKKVARWKTGFYYIALQARVPIVLGFIDYRTKRCGVGKIFYPTGDIVADMEAIQAFYAPFKGKRR